jgi:hypothetical protein
MKPKPQPVPSKLHSEVEIVRLIWLAIFISVFSFLFYYRHGDVLLYGDAVAHINIARRVFDSRTPGLLQLGTVWLPLPHFLILPLVISKQMWQSGAGGSIPSMAAFVFGVLGIFRLMRAALILVGDGDKKLNDVDKISPWIAALLYAANPNLIYMQSTAMGESLYLALFIWAVAYFIEFARKTAPNPGRSLIKCALCLFAACWTRYDGWFLAAILVVATVAAVLFARKPIENNKIKSPTSFRMVLVKFALIVAAAPALWLAYNALVYRNPLEFANGPYSAKAIERKTATVNPAQDNLWAASWYFLKAAELNVGENDWQQHLWLAMALVGSLFAAVNDRGRLALLLWVPLPFYALSVAYGSVPIFLPVWWPFSVYNVRYGLQLLPAFAVFVPLGIFFILRSVGNIPGIPADWRRWKAAATVVIVLALGAISYFAIWRADPICYREASINSRGRLALDEQVANWIKKLPQDSTLLMYLGQHVGALERAGIPLHRTINEGNHRVWRQPTDPEGLWERALADPAAMADYAVGFEGDPVWKAAKDQHLTALVEIHTTGQPPAAIFQARPR